MKSGVFYRQRRGNAPTTPTPQPLPASPVTDPGPSRGAAPPLPARPPVPPPRPAREGCPHLQVGGEDAEVGGHGREPQVGAVGAEEHTLLLAAARSRAAPRALPAAPRPSPQPRQAEEEEEKKKDGAGSRHESRGVPRPAGRPLSCPAAQRGRKAGARLSSGSCCCCCCGRRRAAVCGSISAYTLL